MNNLLSVTTPSGYDALEIYGPLKHQFLLPGEGLKQSTLVRSLYEHPGKVPAHFRD